MSSVFFLLTFTHFIGHVPCFETVALSFPGLSMTLCLSGMIFSILSDFSSFEENQSKSESFQ